MASELKNLNKFLLIKSMPLPLSLNEDTYKQYLKFGKEAFISLFPNGGNNRKQPHISISKSYENQEFYVYDEDDFVNAINVCEFLKKNITSYSKGSVRVREYAHYDVKVILNSFALLPKSQRKHGNYTSILLQA